MRRRPLVLGLAVLAAVAGAPPASPGTGTPIDGRWTWTWTAADMNRAGANAYDRKTLLGAETCTFGSGRWDGRNLSSGRRDGGRFTVSGNIVTFMPEYGPAAPRVVELRFSIYRDRLTWSMVPGRAGWSLLATTPWTRGA